MDPTQIYALGLGIAFGVCVAVRGLAYLGQLFQPYSVLLAKYVAYPLVLKRHSLLGPLSRAELLCHVLYLAVNIFCGTFRVSGIADVGIRAGRL